MKIPKKLKWIIIISIITIIILTIFLYIFINKQTDEVLPASAQPVSDSVPDDTLETFNYTETEIREMIIELSKNRFGEDAYVIPLNADSPSQAEIEGKTRYIYIYAADSLSKQEDVDNIKALYHVDPVTGEIFDNGNGKMEKVQLEDDLNEE